MNLIAIIYFQGMHYTCHVNGICHKKLIPKTKKWFYHDGKREDPENKMKGLLVLEEPILQIDMEKTNLRLYVLIYKVCDS